MSLRRQIEEEITRRLPAPSTITKDARAAGIVEAVKIFQEALDDIFSCELSDPREGGGAMVDAGAPHTRNAVMFDMRKAVIVEGFEVAVAHPTSKGEQADDAVALVIRGRINRPPDDAISAEAPAEQVNHLHMMDWPAAAQLIVEIQSLAARDGFKLKPLLEERWARAKANGLTRRARS